MEKIMDIINSAVCEVVQSVRSQLSPDNSASIDGRLCGLLDPSFGLVSQSVPKALSECSHRHDSALMSPLL